MLLNLTLSNRASSHGQHQMPRIVSQHNGNVVDGQYIQKMYSFFAVLWLN